MRFDDSTDSYDLSYSLRMDNKLRLIEARSAAWERILDARSRLTVEAQIVYAIADNFSFGKLIILLILVGLIFLIIFNFVFIAQVLTQIIIGKSAGG